MQSFEELPPRLKAALLKKSPAIAPFWSLIGLELVDAKKGWAKVKIPFSEKLKNAMGIAHGGAIFSIADTAVGIALVGMLDKNDFLTTLEMKINFLKPFARGEVTAEAVIVHKGAQTAVGDVEVRDQEDGLVAKALTTYAIVKKPNR
jgi:acyl-CoA thioesterase